MAIINNQQLERDSYTNLVIKSTWLKKIIIAGPGTGKTLLFKEIFLKKKGSCIALTFINNLARQLEKDLTGIAEAYTFHAYCKKLLHKTPTDGIGQDFNFFPKLKSIIESDSKILSFNGNNFSSAFQNLIENDGRIDFYLSRANFYNGVGYDDSVYRMLKYFDSHPDKVPVFDQIVVDEYQDFNKLEVSFIEKLSEKSPILIVGDDDQAIYDFKCASPVFIRNKFNDPNFKRFELPFSSRCTQVIIKAVKDIVTKAQAIGKLNGRIDKKLVCYEPDKKEENCLYPMIQYVQCSVHYKKAPYISNYIEREISNISEEKIKKMIQTTKETGEPGILIIGPSHYLDSIYEHLKIKFKNLVYHKREETLNILDGYKILLRDDKANLGWRVLLEFLPIPEKNKIILSGNKKDSIIKQISSEVRKQQLEIVSILRNIREGNFVEENEKTKIKELLGSDCDSLSEKLNEDFDGSNKEDQENEGIKIQLTTFNGSKGLSAAFVFVVGFNNGDFPREPNNPTDNEVCQLIVALTRARSKCYLISNNRFGGKQTEGKSLFLEWIDSSCVDFQEVNKDYFK